MFDQQTCLSSDCDINGKYVGDDSNEKDSLNRSSNVAATCENNANTNHRLEDEFQNKNENESISDVLKKNELEQAQEDEPPVSKKKKSGVDLESTESEVSRQVSLRKFSKIPVFIVDYHNDVLSFLFRCFGGRYLPLQNNILIHFDSHPDMVLSRDIPAESSYDKEIMLDALSIENWIMPMCFVGHFNRIIWLKNSWCEQIPVGKYDFLIGKKDELMCVDIPLGYFISEGNYCKAAEMSNTKRLHLEVHNIDKETVDPNTFLESSDVNNFVLDIDLDFFSTANPFLEIYKEANCYDHLKIIFNFKLHHENIEDVSRDRKNQLYQLKDIFEQLQDKRNFDEVDFSDASYLTPEVKNEIKLLEENLKNHYTDDEIDWQLVFDSGSTADSNGLPHHISSSTELEQYYQRFKEFLKKLPIPPVLITIACSSEDEYCPKSQVRSIEQGVVEILRQVFGDRLTASPILHYNQEEWDIIKL